MNILFIMCDTLRADFLGCYGNNWIRTPGIDLPPSEGAVFTGRYMY
jgi:arylsulfatase A-like enzyme